MLKPAKYRKKISAWVTRSVAEKFGQMPRACHIGASRHSPALEERNVYRLESLYFSALSGAASDHAWMPLLTELEA